MITESEAKQLWCPFVRVGDIGADNAVASNRSCALEVNYNCIASDCMAWEWISGKWEGDDLKARTPEEGKAEYVKRGDCGLKRK